MEVKSQHFCPKAAFPNHVAFMRIYQEQRLALLQGWHLFKNETSNDNKKKQNKNIPELGSFSTFSSIQSSNC